MDLAQMQYYRMKKGYSYGILAERSGVPLSTVRKIFGGITKTPRYETLMALEKALLEDGKCGYLDQAGSEASVDYVREQHLYNASSNARKKSFCTLEDYYALPDEQRVELIDGVFYDMSSPTTIHQTIAFQITHQIEQYIESKDGKCIPFIAPVDVQLDCDDYTMVQPDVMILCDQTKDIGRCIYGAPDFVAEILSPSTRRKDFRVKLAKYANAGVKEYWMVDPDRKQIIVYWFEPSNEIDRSDSVTIYGFEDEVPVSIYEGDLKIDFRKIARKLERADGGNDFSITL